MKQIGIQEVHQRLLNLAKSFDEICTRHNIPYYMLGGTMLGAIRHKGFIPWDDDMDFGVPAQYYSQLVVLLEKELPDSFQCCTHKNHPCVLYPFIKIQDNETCIDDPRSKGELEKQLGINIDVFPLFECDNNDPTLDSIYRLIWLQSIFYVGSTSNNLVKQVLKGVLGFIGKVSPNKNLFIDKIICKSWHLSKGNYWGNIFGRWRRKEIIPKEWYGLNTRYEFENTTLCGIKEFDKYLSQLYGDYMKLPEKCNQTIHCENFYIK